MDLKVLILVKYLNIIDCNLLITEPIIYNMNILKRFKLLSKGIRRLLIVGYGIFWILMLLGIGDAIFHKVNDNETITWIILILGYWIVVFLIIWVYDGFKEKDNIK